MDGEVLNSMKMLDLETEEWRMQSQTLTVARRITPVSSLGWTTRKEFW